MKIVSWNVNGLRACLKKGFLDWLSACDADIVGLQEVRALESDLGSSLDGAREDWWMHFSAAERKGYSGVGLFARRAADRLETKLGVDIFDVEGRVQIGHWGEWCVANVYFPNGQGKGDNSRVPYKLDFYRCLFDKLGGYVNEGKKVVVMGDYNIAHEEIDIARPKENENNSGFLRIERDEMDRLQSLGWVDSFRHFYPDTADVYSWWSQRMRARERNVGWRIDYVLVSGNAKGDLKSASVHMDVMGSDHCPVSVELSDDGWSILSLS